MVRAKTADTATLTGNDEVNVIHGGDGDDMIDGGAGDDTINGGAGIDTIDGGAGNDTINGGAGGDILTGGEGDKDIFIIAYGEGGDMIDFELPARGVSGAQDLVHLKGFPSDKRSSGGNS